MRTPTPRIKDHAPIATPRGLTIPDLLLPGIGQWLGGEPERGGVLAGSFAASAATTAFLWGTSTSLLLLGFAFAIHVAATVDLIQRRAFPGFSRNAVWSGAVFGLGVGLYAPLLIILSLVAWPGLSAEGREGFLVNSRAFRHAAPQGDDLVWYRPSSTSEPRVGRVIACQGEEVEWSDGVLRVDGRKVRRAEPSPAATFLAPQSLAFHVPEGHLLIRLEPGAGLARSPVAGLALVAREQIFGRPWAQLYPLRERRLL